MRNGRSQFGSRNGEPGGRAESSTGETCRVGRLDLLVVGTFAGGGIHRYIDEQVERLQGTLAVETHDMASPPIGDGWRRLVRGVVFGILAMVRFPLYDRPDVVHVHTSHRFSFYRSGMYVLFARYVWQVPVILHVHGSSFDEFVQTDSSLVSAFQRRVFAASDTVLVLSEYWKEIIAAETGIEHIRVFPNAVDPSTFPVDDPHENRSVADSSGTVDEQAGGVKTAAADRPHIVFVSNLIGRKGVRELVDAVRQLSTRRPGEFRVTIAGDGPLADQVETLAEDCEEVTSLGYVSEERKRSLLADGSIYVLPTYAEGLPIAMLEGMAGENAVVTTTVGSIPEVIDEDRGILVEPGDPDALADALEMLVTAPDRRTEMATNNRRATETEFAWARIRAELVALYDEHTTRTSDTHQ